jgi:excisionase family DNA binding protein
MGETQIKYMTLDEASDLCRIPVSSLRKKVYAGEIPAYKPGKCILIDIKDLEVFMKRNKV